jgi:hypothetical protein
MLGLALVVLVGITLYADFLRRTPNDRDDLQ